MKKRIVPMLMAVLLAVSIMAPAASAVSARAISGRPTLKISGTTAYCFGKYSSGNQEDEISITVTLKQGAQTISHGARQEKALSRFLKPTLLRKSRHINWSYLRR